MKFEAQVPKEKWILNWRHICIPCVYAWFLWSREECVLADSEQVVVRYYDILKQWCLSMLYDVSGVACVITCSNSHVSLIPTSEIFNKEDRRCDLTSHVPHCYRIYKIAMVHVILTVTVYEEMSILTVKCSSNNNRIFEYSTGTMSTEDPNCLLRFLFPSYN